LRQHRRVGIDQVVGQYHSKRFVADQVTRAVNGVTESERCALPRIGNVHVLRGDAAQFGELSVPPVVFEFPFDFGGAIAGTG
jgi:hypothetical protein